MTWEWIRDVIDNKKRIRRVSWGKGKFVVWNGYDFVNEHLSIYYSVLGDLLTGQDWEIFEEPKTYTNRMDDISRQAEGLEMCCVMPTVLERIGNMLDELDSKIERSII